MTGTEERFRPDDDQMNAALDVLLYLFEQTGDGAARDKISEVRSMLWNLVEP